MQLFSRLWPVAAVPAAVLLGPAAFAAPAGAVAAAKTGGGWSAHVRDTGACESITGLRSQGVA